MTQVIYPSEKSIFGPWLLDMNHLQRLDTLMEDQMNKLEKYRQKFIDEDFNRLKIEYKDKYTKYTDEELLEKAKGGYKVQRFKKELKIKFKSGKTVLANSFKEILMNKDFEDDLPESFTYLIECVDIEAEITNDLFNNNKIRFKVSTLAIEEAKEIFYEIEKWVKEVSPPLYLKIWRRIGNWGLPLYLVIIFMLPSSQISTEDKLKSEAHKLLEHGLQNNEIAKGLEILLSIETNFENKETNSNFNISDYRINLTKLLILIGIIMINFRPSNIIGICRGEKKLMRWRIWVKIVTYVIPVMILLPILINIITNKL